MSWRERLREASFRGVPFHYDSATDPVGRNGVVHSYPKRDTVYVEDMGLYVGEIRLRAYLIGEDYDQDRDRFVEALNKPGAGTLVHPYFGQIEAFCMPGGQEQRVDAGRMVFFDLTFVRTSAQAKNPAASLSSIEIVGEYADTASLDAGFDFKDVFNIDNLADWVLDDAVGVIEEAAGAMREVIDTLSTGVDNLELIDNVRRQVATITNAAESFARDPLGAAGQMIGAVANIAGAGGGMAGLSALGDLFDRAGALGLRTIQTATPSNQQADTNAGAIRRLVQQLAVAESARMITGGRAFRSASPSQDTAQLLMTASRVESGGTLIPVAGRASTSGLIDADLVASSTAGLLSDAGLIVVDERAQTREAIAFATSNDALSARDELLARIDALLADASARSYRTLLALRSALAIDIKQRAATLPELTEYTPGAVRPSLAIAWDLYGDADRALEIATRNAIPHPGFVPGGRALEVLSA